MNLIRIKNAFRILLLLAALALLAWGSIGHPYAGWLCGALLLYGGVALRWPYAPLILLPALLPVLDFAPLTGRFYLDEFDLLVLATLLVAYRKPAGASPPVYFPTAARILFGVFALSVALATIIGALPWRGLDLNSLNHYYSQLNGLRVSKGLLWCLLLLPAFKRRMALDPAATYAQFTLGMLLGAAGAEAIVLWERTSFPGLLNFSSGYRVAGPFAGMHVGGAQIEAYFVLALPFVAWVALMHRHWFLRAFALAVFVAGCYCMMVTYARGGYVAMLIALLALVAAIPFMRTIALRPPQAVVMVLLFVLMGAMAVPVLRGGYMQDRFATSRHDLAARAAQWMRAMRMMDLGPRAALFGMGSGRYPQLSWATETMPDRRPAEWQFVRGGEESAGAKDRGNENVFLRLDSGEPLYFEQLVDVHPDQDYRIRFLARAASPEAVLSLPLCQKWLLYSARCFRAKVVIGDTAGEWRPFTAEVHTSGLREGPWYARRPFKFAMFNSGAAPIDVDRISMRGPAGELIRNGDFERGLDHWYFSTDRFEDWHFENTWLQVYFEQGALGLAVFLMLVTYAAWFSSTRLREPGFPLPPLGGAMIGFMALGTLDSLFDFPRLALLFFLILAMIFLREDPPRHLSQPHR